MGKRILLAVLLSGMMMVSRAQMFVVGTEATSDLLMAPSLGLELVTGNYSSVAVNGFYCGGSWLGFLKDASITALQPEYRYWFSGRPIHKWFVGVGGLAALYDINYKGKEYDGYALGVGLTYGYVINLTRRLNIDIHSGFGVVMYNRKEYFLHDNYDTYYSREGEPRPNSKGYYLWPTRIGVSVTYILK